MPLVAATMRSNVVNALNALTYPNPNPPPATLKSFNIDPTIATYWMIDEICNEFVSIWTTCAMDMSTGTGPPPPGPYPHSHTLLGTNKTFISSTLQVALLSAIEATGYFKVGLQATLYFTQCWSKAIIEDSLDNLLIVTDVQSGAASHTHSWIIMPPASLVVTQMDSCMIQKFGSGKFDPTHQFSFFNSLIQELATEVFRALLSDSTIGPAVGQGHIHTLS